MAIADDFGKNAMATRFGTLATHAHLFTANPTAAAPAGTVIAAARLAITWTAPNTVGPAGATLQPATIGRIYGQVVFNVAAGETVTGVGYFDALTAGNRVDWGDVTDQPFASAGKYTLNCSHTQA